MFSSITAQGCHAKLEPLWLGGRAEHGVHAGTHITAPWGLLNPPNSSEQTKRIPFPSEQTASADAFGWVRLCWTLGIRNRA